MSLTAAEIALVKKNARNVQFEGSKTLGADKGKPETFLAWGVRRNKRLHY